MPDVIGDILFLLGVPQEPSIRVELLMIPDQLPPDLRAPCSVCGEVIFEALIGFITAPMVGTNAALCHNCITDAVVSWQPLLKALDLDGNRQCHVITLGTGETLHTNPSRCQEDHQ